MHELAQPVVELTDVRVRRGTTMLLDGLDLRVETGQRWVVLGPNGAGKTTLLQVASTYLLPTSGNVHVLGSRVGRVDVWPLRRRIGYASAAYARILRPELTALEAVVTGAHAAAATFGHVFSDEEVARGRALLADAGMADLAERRIDRLSEGERQRVQLARTLMADPDLLLLDEPMAGVDVAGRERLIAQLEAVDGDAGPAAVVLVTHHVEEIPSTATHTALLRDGRVLTAGPIDAVLTAEALGECFGVPLTLERRRGRWSVWHQPQG